MFSFSVSPYSRGKGGVVIRGRGALCIFWTTVRQRMFTLRNFVFSLNHSPLCLDLFSATGLLCLLFIDIPSF